MKQFKICKNTPPPIRESHRLLFDRMPLAQMEPGDSIKLMDLTGDSRKNSADQSRYSMGLLRATMRHNLCGLFKVCITKGKKGKELRIYKFS